MGNSIKKIAITGPESTGKSTLTKALAQHYQTNFVPEFARLYLTNLQREYTYDDLLIIAKCQIELEETNIQTAKNGLLFCDTDLFVLKIWSEHKFGKCHSWVENQIQKQNYDAYFLMDIDFPWVEDPLREHPEIKMRAHFFTLYLNLLRNSGLPFFILSGDENVRLNTAVEWIDRYIRLK